MTMKKYTFEFEGKLIHVYTAKGLEEAEKMVTPRLLSITKRMPMNGIVWR